MTLISSGEALDRAIDVLNGQTNLATSCGKKQGHVSYWIEKGRIPSEHCIAVELATTSIGKPVTRYELRPDVFGDQPTTCLRCGCFQHAKAS